MSNTKQLLLNLPLNLHHALKVSAVKDQRTLSAHATRLLATAMGGTVIVGDHGVSYVEPKGTSVPEDIDHLWAASNGDPDLYETLRVAVSDATKPRKSNLAAVAANWDKDE